jgi:hypothetical protein
MDPRDRADALLARAQARGAFVVTPDNATSPMDSSNTQQIPRSMVNDIDYAQDPDSTGRIAASVIEENDHPLAGAQPTKRLEIGGGERRRQQAQPTAPIVRRPAAKPIPSPLKSQQPTSPLEVQSAKKKEEAEDREFSGLIPTTTQSTGRSNLSRRLDGI